MSYRLIPMTREHLPALLDFAKHIYANSAPGQYPDFRITSDVDTNEKHRKFFMAFMLPAEFVNHNIRQCYALVDQHGIYQAAVGVKRWSHMPSWSISWLLSPMVGIQFVSIFRSITHNLCAIHEAAGMNEFYASYPSHREAAYSRIMLPLRERYYSFVECTVAAHAKSQYSMIHDMMGHTLHPHDMNLRRYILRRDNTSPVIKLSNTQ